MKSKILKILGLFMLTLIVFVWATPFLFKGKITRMIRSHINRDMQAHVSFSDVDISLFRHFPKISLGLDNLQVICVGEFDGDTLLTAKQLDIACDIRSLISGDSINIHSLTMNQPQVHALIQKNGHHNWDIMRPSGINPIDASTPARPFKMDLQSYAIHNGLIDFVDENKNLHLEWVNLEQEGTGNFNSDQFTLKTKTTADALNVKYDGSIPYRLTAKTKIEASIRINNNTHTYSFNTDRVALNDLKIHTEGFFQWINDSSYDMHIKFNTPSTEFKNILSMLPAVYQNDFASIKSRGQVLLNGFIKGKYNDQQVPAYHLNLEVKNGFFQYPDLQIPAENINLTVHVDNPDGKADHLTVNIPRAHVDINDGSLDFHLLIKNQSSKPYIDLGFVGNLDLANVSKLMKLESGSKLEGKLDADFFARGNIPGTENQKKDAFQSKGRFDLENFRFLPGNGKRGLSINELSMAFTPKNILVENLKGVYCSSQVEATGVINNLFAYAISDEPLRASIKLKTDDAILKDWINPGRDSSTTIAANFGNFVVPDNVNLTIQADAANLHYDDLDMRQVSGELVLSEQTLHLNHIQAEALDGTMIVDGSYSTLESREHPEISMIYDSKGLDVQKTFFAFNIVQKILPVGKFISGRFNSTLTLKGRLGSNMVPDPATLHGEGTVLLTDGALKGFGPLDKLAESLDIAGLKELILNDVKTDFAFKSGKVALEPFIVYGKDLVMEIGGTHGFDQSLDYGINLKVSRGQLGSKGNSFVKNVVTQAADKGIPVRLKNEVNMNVKMTGTINNPDVKTDMDAVVDHAAHELKKEVDDFVNAKLDSAKQQLHHPTTPAKKPIYVQASYKSGSASKSKKHVTATKKKHVVHSKTKPTKKKSRKSYSKST